MNYVPILSVVIASLALLYSMFRGGRDERRVDTHEIEKRAAENATINMKLDEIVRKTNESASDLKSLRQAISSQNDRLIKAEESIKSLHHRVNTVETRMNGGSNNED